MSTSRWTHQARLAFLHHMRVCCLHLFPRCTGRCLGQARRSPWCQFTISKLSQHLGSRRNDLCLLIGIPFVSLSNHLRLNRGLAYPACTLSSHCLSQATAVSLANCRQVYCSPACSLRCSTFLAKSRLMMHFQTLWFSKPSCFQNPVVFC